MIESKVQRETDKEMAETLSVARAGQHGKQTNKT
jgi:hypothetical protein